jgi:hypothetical protein
MAARLLLYIARVYENIVDSNSLYRAKKILMPRPEFIVFTTGARTALI